MDSNSTEVGGGGVMAATGQRRPPPHQKERTVRETGVSDILSNRSMVVDEYYRATGKSLVATVSSTAVLLLRMCIIAGGQFKRAAPWLPAAPY